MDFSECQYIKRTHARFAMHVIPECKPTVMSPIGLSSTALKSWAWHCGSYHVVRYGQSLSDVTRRFQKRFFEAENDAMDVLASFPSTGGLAVWL